MAAIGEIFGMFWNVWSEMFSATVELAPKIISFLLWLLCAPFVLVCVFVAGNLYPAWQKWGEEM